jgi:programmed cell death protein 5
MADPELAALRAARLTQLQQSNTDENGQSAARSEDAEKRRAEEQMRRDLLATALEPAARERRMSNHLLSCLYSAGINNASTVSRIALVSPTRSNQIESILLRMLQAGQLRGRVSEQQLIDLLEQVRLYSLGSYISAFENHKYRPTKLRKRLRVRVLSWYVLVADNSRPEPSRWLTHCAQFQRRVDLDDDDFDI